jgi:DNA-binding response OmpR family regulator
MAAEKKILVVDDSMTTLVLLEWFLEQNGYKTILASDADEAYNLLKENKPDLILLDIMMPKITGFQFMETLKTSDINFNVPILIISAMTAPEFIQNAKELGATDYVPKPFNLNELLKKINALIG